MWNWRELAAIGSSEQRLLTAMDHEVAARGAARMHCLGTALEMERRASIVNYGIGGREIK